MTAIKASGTNAMIHGITVRDAVFFYEKTGTAIDDPGMITLEKVRLETY